MRQKITELGRESVEAQLHDYFEQKVPEGDVSYFKSSSISKTVNASSVKIGKTLRNNPQLGKFNVEVWSESSRAFVWKVSRLS